MNRMSFIENLKHIKKVFGDLQTHNSLNALNSGWFTHDDDDFRDLINELKHIKQLLVSEYPSFDLVLTKEEYNKLSKTSKRYFQVVDSDTEDNEKSNEYSLIDRPRIIRDILHANILAKIDQIKNTVNHWIKLYERIENKEILARFFLVVLSPNNYVIRNIQFFIGNLPDSFIKSGILEEETPSLKFFSKDLTKEQFSKLLNNVIVSDKLIPNEQNDLIGPPFEKQAFENFFGVSPSILENAYTKDIFGNGSIWKDTKFTINNIINFEENFQGFLKVKPLSSKNNDQYILNIDNINYDLFFMDSIRKNRVEVQIIQELDSPAILNVRLSNMKFLQYDIAIPENMARTELNNINITFQPRSINGTLMKISKWKFSKHRNYYELPKEQEEGLFIVSFKNNHESRYLRSEEPSESDIVLYLSYHVSIIHPEDTTSDYSINSDIVEIIVENLLDSEISILSELFELNLEEFKPMDFILRKERLKKAISTTENLITRLIEKYEIIETNSSLSPRKKEEKKKKLKEGVQLSLSELRKIVEGDQSDLKIKAPSTRASGSQPEHRVEEFRTWLREYPEVEEIDELFISVPWLTLEYLRNIFHHPSFRDSMKSIYFLMSQQSFSNIVFYLTYIIFKTAETIIDKINLKS